MGKSKKRYVLGDAMVIPDRLGQQHMYVEDQPIYLSKLSSIPIDRYSLILEPINPKKRK